jgi:hypothetical protein
MTTYTAKQILALVAYGIALGFGLGISFIIVLSNYLGWW